jgi:hypothetical protein
VAARFAAIGFGTEAIIAGLRLWGLTAPWVLDGPMPRAAFNLYVETQLAPTLDKGDVVILITSAVTKATLHKTASRRGAPGSCSCRPTAPI